MPRRSMRLRTCFHVAALLLLALTPVAVAAEPFAYVPNEGSGTLSVIDTANDRLVSEVPAGQKPRGTVVSADGRRAWVSDQPAKARAGQRCLGWRGRGKCLIDALRAGLIGGECDDEVGHGAR